MIDFKKKLKVSSIDDSKSYATIWAKHCRLGATIYDIYGKRWEVGEDVNFDKFWFREVQDKEADLVVKGFRKDD